MDERAHPPPWLVVLRGNEMSTTEVQSSNGQLCTGVDLVLSAAGRPPVEATIVSLHVVTHVFPLVKSPHTIFAECTPHGIDRSPCRSEALQIRSSCRGS